MDDDELILALRRAVQAREAVPPDFVTAAKGAFAWHNIDAELAQLTYDSTADDQAALTMRAEAASIRALTFTSAHLTIELEVVSESVLGQVIPAEAATIKVQPRDGAESVVAVDEIGCFSIQPIPDRPFRLHCTTRGGLVVVTRWITL